MKYFVIAVLGFLVVSCSNDFEIIEEPKDIPIVYGILSVTDTAHYIRLERAFIDASIPAAEIAMRPDSLYYANAEVSLRNVATDEFYDLVRVDGASEGFPREAGSFAQSPNYVYKIHSSEINLQQGINYQLIIDRNIENLPLVTAQTRIVTETQFRTPNPASQSILNFDYNQFTSFSWRDHDYATIYDLYLRFNYRERAKGSGNMFEPKTATWRVVSDEKLRKVDIIGLEFYSFLIGAIPVDENVERVFVNVGLTLDCGGTEIEEYIRVGDANLGITSSQDIPTYSNLSEGRGLFSSSYTEEIEGLGLSNKTLDSLIMGTVTGSLNFQ